MPFVGYILVLMAAGTVILVLYLVVREQTEQDEWYIPPPEDQTNSEPTPMSTAEVVGTQMTSPSPVIDAEAKHRAEENRE